MFDKAKSMISEIREDNRRKKEERARLEQEQAEEAVRLAKERAEEAARIERERIQAEKEALMQLSDKELLVEMIMAIRGYNTRIDELGEQIDNIGSALSSLESDVECLSSDVSYLKYSANNN